MNNYLGDFAEDADVYIVFDTADSTGLSVTATIAVANIEVYRQNTGSINLTQRSSTTGFTLDVDHDGMAGTHMVAIDTSDNTDAGFFAIAYDYFVKLNTVTVDGISISKWIGHFSIENRHNAAADDLANGTDGLGALKVLIDAVQTDLNTLTAGVTLAAGAITNASLAGNMEVVFETDFATNYNTTRKAWSTNVQDFIGTSASDPFNGQVISASVTGDTKQTADVAALITTVGTAGANLTDLGGMSTGMKAEVNIEADAAFTTYDPPTKTEMDSAFTEIKGATWAAGTDTLEHIRDKQTDIETDTADIQTRLPAALVGGAMDSDVSVIQADAVSASALATDAVNEIRDALLPTQNAAFNNIEFLFVAASDHVTPVTSATGTGVTRSIDGGAFGTGTGTLAEVDNGIYQYDASPADMNGGIITFRFTGTGGSPGAPDDAFVTIVTGGGV